MSRPRLDAWLTAVKGKFICLSRISPSHPLEVIAISIEENKAIVQAYIAEVMSAGNLDRIADFFIPGSMLAGGIASQIQAMRTPFPDMTITIDEMVAEGSLVAVRITHQATHSGPLVGLPAFGRLQNPIPPTGKRILNTSMMFFRLADGKIASLATEVDQMGLLQQLGWTLTPPGR